MCYFELDDQELEKSFSNIARSEELQHGKGAIMQIKEEYKNVDNMNGISDIPKNKIFELIQRIKKKQ